MVLLVAVVFSFPPQMQQQVVCFMVPSPLFSPHFPSFFNSLKFCFKIFFKKYNGATNYDENTVSAGFSFADACASEYSKKKEMTVRIFW